ncbi:paralemmin-2 [Gymnodraco acuticeps]|uniref:Paralemmin-2 n=1 Tax=Gymnodraco acuticeps TaxID=8218 RepID=A0A6P8T2Y3_GYMAC|nr:paralemmin-2 [Gymnodraco acuticeps]
MKKQARGPSLSSPAGGSGVQLHHDFTSLAFKMQPANGHALVENGPHSRRDGASEDERMEGSCRNSSWVLDCQDSGENNSTDPHEALTETSTLTFVDVHESAESHSLHGLVYLREFVLIDDDDDGDMSLREKTVTDLTVMDGRAADLVCGRLLSTSSGSLSESREEEEAEEEPQQEEEEAAGAKKRCCFCTLL